MLSVLYLSPGPYIITTPALQCFYNGVSILFRNESSTILYLSILAAMSPHIYCHLLQSKGSLTKAKSSIGLWVKTWTFRRQSSLSQLSCPLVSTTSPDMGCWPEIQHKAWIPYITYYRTGCQFNHKVINRHRNSHASVATSCLPCWFCSLERSHLSKRAFLFPNPA